MSAFLSRVPQPEILDLRHFSAAQIRPLLRDEAQRWQQRLHWDYAQSTNLLLEYLDSRVLPGFVAVQGSRVLGYTFCVFEAAKAVIGDVYAFGETEATTNPLCDRLLTHLLEMLQAAPGVDRVESQLLMFPDGALHGPFFSAGFRSYPRLFMLCDLDHSLLGQQARSIPQNARDQNTRDWSAGPGPVHPTPEGFLLHPWRQEFYDSASDLIFRSYANHMDAGINDQYQTLHGAQRFLHNIIRFPGCGTFDAENSWLLRNPASNAIEAMILCSRVRSDVGHITQLCVSPPLRGRGLGSMLLHQCASALAPRGIRTLTLTVTEANRGALHLYQRLGFSALHRFEAMVWDKRPSG